MSSAHAVHTQCHVQCMHSAHAVSVQCMRAAHACSACVQCTCSACVQLHTCGVPGTPRCRAARCMAARSAAGRAAGRRSRKRWQAWHGAGACGARCRGRGLGRGRGSGGARCGGAARLSASERTPSPCQPEASGRRISAARSSAAGTAPSSAGFSAVSYASSGPAVLEAASIVTSSVARSYEDAHFRAGSARSCSWSATRVTDAEHCLRAARPGRRPATSAAAAASMLRLRDGCRRALSASQGVKTHGRDGLRTRDSAQTWSMVTGQPAVGEKCTSA